MTNSNVDAIDVFIEEATLTGRDLRLSELPPLRGAAIAELVKRYGPLMPETAERIEDPLHRFIFMSEISNRAWEKHKEMDALRTKRTTAIQILYFDYGWRPMEIVRHIGATDRRIVDFAVMNTDRTTLPSRSEKWAEEAAKTAHAEYIQRKDDGVTIRPLRDQMIHELSEGRWEYKAGRKQAWKRLSDEELTKRREAGKPVGRIWTNAEISRLAKMTTAAVAQIRGGTAPSARRAAAAA